MMDRCIGNTERAVIMWLTSIYATIHRPVHLRLRLMRGQTCLVKCMYPITKDNGVTYMCHADGIQMHYVTTIVAEYHIY